MTLDLDDAKIGVHEMPPVVIRRNTNTLVVKLVGEDEVLTLIEDLARTGASRMPIYLVIEADKITYARTVDDEGEPV